MKKNIFWGSILINAVLLSYIGYLHYRGINREFSSVSESCAVPDSLGSPLRLVGTHRSAKKYKVAVLTPVSHPSLELIQKGFMETLIKERGLNIDFNVYNANGNRTLMRAQVEEIVQKDYDMIFTIGAVATQMAKEVTVKKQRLVPIVFGAVARPVKLDLIASEQSSGNHITGLAADPDYKKQIEVLLLLKPDVKNVVVVYDPTQSSGLDYDRGIVERVFKEHHINIRSVEIYKTSEVHQKVASLLEGVDVLFIFKDNTIVPAVDSLVKLCMRYGVTLCATDLDSVDKGAAIGFSVGAYSYGVESASKAYAVLVEKRHPSTIPITQAKDYKVRLNSHTMYAQNLKLDPNLVFLLQSSEIV